MTGWNDSRSSTPIAAYLAWRTESIRSLRPSYAQGPACAHEQGDQYFWSFHNYLFEHQREIAPDNLRSTLAAHSATLEGFDKVDFQACMDEKRTAAKVEQDVALGSEMGVSATPTLFINGQMVTGVQSEQIRTYIREITAERSRE